MIRPKNSKELLVGTEGHHPPDGPFFEFQCERFLNAERSAAAGPQGPRSLDSLEKKFYDIGRIRSAGRGPARSRIALATYVTLKYLCTCREHCFEPSLAASADAARRFSRPYLFRREDCLTV